METERHDERRSGEHNAAGGAALTRADHPALVQAVVHAVLAQSPHPAGAGTPQESSGIGELPVSALPCGASVLYCVAKRAPLLRRAKLLQIRYLAHAGLGVAPSSSALSHVRTIGTPGSDPGPAGKTDDTEKSQGAVAIGAGLPPVPKKLVKRILAGEFIDMSELLPDRLGAVGGQPLEDEHDHDRCKGSKPKRRQVAHILEWLQCFSVYMAVIASEKPENVQDLLGYQALILEARMEYEGDAWVAGL